MSPLQAFMLKRVAKNQAIKKKVKLWLRVHLTLLLFAGGGFLLLMMIILMLVGAMLVDSDSPDSSCSGGGSSSVGILNDMSGTDGDWTKKGTKSYNASKSIYEDALHDGCDAKHASAVVGNGLHESAFFGVNVGEPWTIWPHQAGGGGGQGIFQFSPGGCPIPSDKSIAGQTKQILTVGGNDSVWKHMSGSPYHLGMEFDALIERGDETTDRGTLSQKAYELFGGIKGGATSSDTADTASTSSSDCGGSDSGSTSNIVQYAESQIGKHPYSEGMGTGMSSRNGMLHWPNSGDADCSSFCYFVLKHCGYKVPAFNGNAWTSPSTCKRIPASETRAGDIAWNSDHMVILRGHAKTGNWSGYNSNNAPIVEEGGGTATHPNEQNVNNSTIGMAENESVEFFRPVKA